MRERSCVVTLHLFAFMLYASPATAQDNRGVVWSSYGEVVTNSFGNCVRTQWSAPADACAPQQAEAVLAPPPAPPAPPRREIAVEDRTVYFDFDKASLRQEARQKIDSLAEILKTDSQITDASIVGYADRIGAPQYNEQLSRRRAEAVQQYLTSRGYLRTGIAETRWVGENRSETNCPDSLSRPELIACLQGDRKVEVEIHYVQPAAGSR